MDGIFLRGSASVWPKRKVSLPFRKDHRDPVIFAGRCRKRFPNLAEARENFWFSQEPPSRVRVWFRRESDRDPKTDPGKQNRTAQDRLVADGRVGFAERPSSASRAHEGASRRDRRTVPRKSRE